MQTIKINIGEKVPDNYTGIVEHLDGTKEWFLNGLLHRKDGPAIEYSNGEKHWYLNWKNLNEEKIQQLLDLGYPEKTAIKLVYYIETGKHE